MSKKLTVILIAIAVAVAFAASMAVAGDPPTQMTIDKAAAEKSGVAFDHAKHSGTIDCMKCHHKEASKDAIQSCFACHGADAAAPSVKDAFHKQCKDCHKEQAQGPTKCKECHP